MQYQLPAITNGLTKTQVKIAAEQSISDLLETGNILQAAEAISAMEAFIKEVKADKRYTEYVREEVEKHGKVFTSASGAKIELAETGTKYDFSKCNDFLLPRLNQQSEEIGAKIKDREAFLKAIPTTGVLVIDEETGETVTVYPPAKASTSSYKVTLEK